MALLFFYLMGKMLSGQLSYMQAVLFYTVCTLFLEAIFMDIYKENYFVVAPDS